MVENLTSRRSQELRPQYPSFTVHRRCHWFPQDDFWIVAGAIPIVALTAAQHWPSEFAKTFPIGIVKAHEQRIVGSRLFTSDQWGDYILYKLWPRQKVFVDGRSDFYGEKLGNEYLSLMNADFKWYEVSKKYGFNLMLLPVKWPLASVLKLSPQWKVVADDGTAILFETAQAETVTPKIPVPGLMERISRPKVLGRD